jgi:hypothetical protein
MAPLVTAAGSALGRPTPAPSGMSLGVVETWLGVGEGVSLGDALGEALWLGESVTTGLMTITLGPGEGVSLGRQVNCEHGVGEGDAEGVGLWVGAAGCASGSGLAAVAGAVYRSAPKRGRSRVDASPRARLRREGAIASGSQYRIPPRPYRRR